MITTRPEVVSIEHRRVGIAGQYAYVAKIFYDHDDAPAEHCIVTFVSTEYGNPGPVLVQPENCDGVFVTDPGRHGDKLNPQWIRNYFGS